MYRQRQQNHDDGLNKRKDIRDRCGLEGHWSKIYRIRYILFTLMKIHLKTKKVNVIALSASVRVMSSNNVHSEEYDVESMGTKRYKH